MKDAPLFSPRRIWMAVRRWVWWCGDQGLTFPFWFFMHFEGRPFAREKSGKMAVLERTATPWYTKEEMWG